MSDRKLDDAEKQVQFIASWLGDEFAHVWPFATAYRLALACQAKRNAGDRRDRRAILEELLTAPDPKGQDTRLVPSRSLQEKERARCLQVCRDYAVVCYAQAEKQTQLGRYGEAKEFTEQAKAAEHIAVEIRDGR